MKKSLALSIFSAAFVLTGCDLPDKLTPPDATATWTRAADPLGTQPATTLTIDPNGTFTAEQTPRIIGETTTITGRWGIDLAWQEQACWERVRRKEDLYLVGRTGSSTRVSRATVRLRYWVAKGADLPNGAKVVDKRTLFAVGDKLGRVVNYRGPISEKLAGREPDTPKDARGEHWLVEENAELIRTAAATRSSGNLLFWPFEVLSECLMAPDKNATLRLRFRDRNLNPKTS